MAMAKNFRVFIVMFWFASLSAIIESKPLSDLEEYLDVPKDDFMEPIAWDTPVRICGPHLTIMEGKVSCNTIYQDKLIKSLRIYRSGGIVTECCSAPCTPLHILQYCENQKTKIVAYREKIDPMIVEHRSIISTTTTTTTVAPEVKAKLIEKIICDKYPDDYRCGYSNNSGLDPLIRILSSRYFR